MSDETQAGIAPADETVVVAPIVDYPETPAAWSLDETEPIDPRTWASTWGHAAAIAGICVAVAFAIGVIGVAIVIASGHARPVPINLPAQTSTPAALPATPAGPIALRPDDDEFVALAIAPAGVHNPISGGFGSSGTQQHANEIALSECRVNAGQSDCVLAGAGMFHGCVSYAVAAVGSEWAAGSGRTPDAARADAIRRLDSAAGYVVAKCSIPPGVGGQ